MIFATEKVLSFFPIHRRFSENDSSAAISRASSSDNKEWNERGPLWFILAIYLSTLWSNCAATSEDSSYL